MRSAILSLLLSAFVVVGLAGCSLLSEDPPEEARISFDGSAGTTGRLVVSTSFLSQRVPVIDSQTGLTIGDTLATVLIEADTFDVTFPYDETFDITDNRQIYLELVRNNPADDDLIGRLWIDGEERSSREGSPNSELMIFIYNYRGRPADLPPVEV